MKFTFAVCACLARCTWVAGKKMGKPRSIFLVGPTGVGKSALGSELVASDDDDGESAFEVSSDMESKTSYVSSLSKVYKYTRDKLDNMMNDEEEIFLTVSDSPGLSDSKGRSTQFLDDIINNMREAKPHGVVFVVRSGRDSHELQLSMRVLKECLGVLLEDPRRIALFVNRLPTDFQLRMETPPIKKPDAQAQKRLEMVLHARTRISELLQLKPAFQIRSAFGNTDGTWDGMEPLKKFIAEMPDKPMDLTNVRTWTEVMDEAEWAVDRSLIEARQLQNLRQQLEHRISTIQENIAYFNERWGADCTRGEWKAATLAVSISYGLSLFVPGLNVATSLAAAATTAAVATTAGVATLEVLAGHCNARRSSLEESLEEAKNELDIFLSQNVEEQKADELRRKQKLLKDVEDLQERINTVEV